MADELAQLQVRDLALADLAREVDVLQHLGQAGVVAFQAAQGAIEKASHVVVGLVDQMLPARRRWNVERLAVPAFEFGALLGLGLGLASSDLLRDDLLTALVKHVRTAFEEKHPEDVFLELRGVHLAAQDVGGFEKVTFELLEGNGHRGPRESCCGECIGGSLRSNSENRASEKRLALNVGWHYRTSSQGSRGLQYKNSGHWRHQFQSALPWELAQTRLANGSKGGKMPSMNTPPPSHIIRRCAAALDGVLDSFVRPHKQTSKAIVELTHNDVV